MSAQTIQPVDIPRVNGRHQDKALARARKTRAIELKLQGLTYQQIADQMGYKNRGSVYTIIREAQVGQLGEVAEEHRETELARLDALQEGLWTKALDGDVAAAAVVLKLIDSRCRLLGLYDDRRPKDPHVDWDCCQGPPTLVIRDDDCRHKGCPGHGRFPTSTSEAGAGLGINPAIESHPRSP